MAADAISERGMLEGVVEAVGQATVLLVRDEANAIAIYLRSEKPSSAETICRFTSV